MSSTQDSTGNMGLEAGQEQAGQAETTGGVAIIGMSCRFPGAATVAAFWRNLREGVESIKHFSDEELDRAVIDPAELGDPRYVKARAVLDGIDRFDARFFEFSPREAEITDPQQRILLECAWEAFESAGYDPTNHPRPIGVFAGAGANGYLLYNLSSAGHLVGTVNAFQAVIHNKNDHVATRLAYKLNLKGPAITVQTACSTSLVGVVLACQSLLSYQCDMALAGGVTITVPQNTGYLYTERGIGSPDGRCRAFDARAQGTVGGSGAGVVILKRLEDALADGDTIHAVIRGGALNNDGSFKVGYTAPSVDGQAEVIAMAQALAEVHPETISYVEAHGTGTPLGDPIEIQALTQAFRRHTEKRQYCAIGSVKTQVGHLDTAAGVAGLIKTVLALEHRSLPPSLHFEAPNPEIDFAASPFYVNDRLRDWPAGPEPRRAGVSSFGLGGTNAHVVLEEAPAAGAGGPGGPARPLQLVLLSAKTDGALEAATSRLGEYLRTPPSPSSPAPSPSPSLDGAASVALADVAYTLHAGRKAFAHRRMFVCRDRAEAATLLGTLEPERVYSRVQEPVHRPLTFMFPGQGSQYPGMGAELYRGEPVFREEVDRCLGILERQHGVLLRDVLLPGAAGGGGGGGDLAAAAERLKQTALAQPALFVIEYALAKLWMSWGIQPTSMIGHSVGEYVAACLAGVFSLEDALGLIAVRGRLIQGLPAGSMLIVPLPEREVLTLLGAELSLAAVNSPELCVISGPGAAVDALDARLTGRGVICRRLHTSHAFHSAMMDPILGEFRQTVARVGRKAPRLPFLSNVTGTWITAAEAQDPEYWTRHLRQTVRFAAGLEVLLAEPEAVLLEVGPGRTLRTIARWNPMKKPAQFMLATLPHPDEGQTDYGVLLHTIGHLWLAGIEVDAAALYAGQKRRRLPLPTYPFERQRYWVDLRPGAGQGHRLGGSLEKQPDVSRWFYVPVWKEVPRVPAGPRGSASDGGPWLVFVDALGIGERFVNGLERDGHEVVAVRAGEGFRLLDERHVEVHPRRREDYEALLGALRERGRFPTRIAHFWSLAESPGDSSGQAGLAGGSQLEAQLDIGFFSLLALAQALGSVPAASAGPTAASAKGSKAMEWMIVTNNAQEVVGGDLTRPEQATVRGPCLVIPREYPNVRCRHVDIALPPPRGAQAERLVAALLAEAQADGAETVVAYRGGHRWVQGFESLPLAETKPAELPLREQGVYLITGGLGGLGYTFAEDLARTLRARLVLVGRSPLPERSGWPQALATGDEAVKQKIRQVQALEALGAEVLVGQADVGDLEALRRVVAEAQRRFGPALHGVIHAAGVPGGGMIQRKSREAALEVLWPKVRGAQVLAAVTAGCELDFFLFCSSLTTAVPRFGQVDYTAANAFLDAFAQQVAQSGRLAVAVDWGAWDDVGMAARNTEGGERALRVIDHPLLERCLREEPGREVYATDYNVDKHWVLDEHRILGNPVIPGVAYFEMVRAALDERVQGRSVRFEDVFFLAPLRVRDGETREVRLVLEQDDDSHFRFAIRSREGQGQDAAAAKLRDFTIGSVALIAPAAEPGHEAPAKAGRTLDVDELRRRCNVQELLLPAEQREEDLGPRWHSVQRVYIGHNEVLLVLELPEAFAADFDRMVFHPALLDRAAGIAKNFLAREGAYLPLNYKKLTIHDRLQRKIYSYARFHEEESADRETITFDIALMDEHGRVLVDIERFTQKRVNDPGSEIRALAAAARPVDEVEPARREEIRPAEGVVALRRILAAAGAAAGGMGVSPRVVVSVRDLQASIEQTDQVIQERILAAAEQQRTAGGVRPRPALNNDYVPPRNEIERRIAAAWQEILGVERVGIHDNFFDLGGDSVQAIQIIAKASHAGVQLNPQQFFQYATIAELAEMLAGILAEQADQGAIVGPVPLTPAQRAFLVEHPAPGQHDPHYEGLLLELSQALDAAVPREAVRALLGHHDALRLRFVREAAGGWQQVSATVSDAVAWAEIDLSSLGEAAQKERLPAIVEETAAGLRLGEGPVFTAARIRRGGAQRDLLLVLAHRLVVDGPSWRILLPDLQSLCQTQGGKGGGRLPPKTAPFKAWAERLVAQVTAVPDGEATALWAGDEWKGVSPLFGESTSAPERPVRALTVSLSPEQTRALVDEVQPTYRASMSEILATGLLLSLVAATGRTSWFFGVVGDAREAFAELDLSRTVGWFATTYPVRLEHGVDAPLGEVLQSVKARLRRGPGQAASYDLLRAGEGGRKELPRVEIELCYWGSVDELAPAAAGLASGGAQVSVVRSLGLDPDRRLRVEGLLQGGRLELRFVYDEVACTSALVERFAQECLRSLAALIEHGRTSEAHVSPTDFPLADLDESQLGALADLIDQADQLDS